VVVVGAEVTEVGIEVGIGEGSAVIVHTRVEAVGGEPSLVHSTSFMVLIHHFPQRKRSGVLV
jgi:hypothetical protein